MRSAGWEGHSVYRSDLGELVGEGGCPHRWRDEPDAAEAMGCKVGEAVVLVDYLGGIELGEIDRDLGEGDGEGVGGEVAAGDVFVEGAGERSEVD